MSASIQLHARDECDASIIGKVVADNGYDLKGDLSGAIILDVGAHVGSFSVACLTRGAEAVYCYEADPEAAALCSENLSMIGVGLVHVDPSAVWAGDPLPETLRFSRTITENSGTGSAVFWIDSIMPSWQAPVVDFDDILESIHHEHRRPITILKLDCEGAEYPILYLSESLELVENIVLEYHEPEVPLTDDFEGTIDIDRMSGREMAEFLRDAGFSVIGQPMIDTGIIWASRDPGNSPFGCFDDVDETDAVDEPSEPQMSVNLVAGSGANRGPGSWIFSRMAKEIEDRLNAIGDVRVVVTETPDRSRPYDVYHYLHSTLAVQHGHMLHRSLVTVHSLDSVAPERTFQSKAEMLSKVPMVTCVSKPILDELVDRGIDPSKMHFTPQGVDLDVFHPADEDLTGNEFRIGVIGRRYEDGRKGERFLCQVLELLDGRLGENTELRIVFVGPNWDTGPIRRLMADDGPLVHDGVRRIHFEFLGMLDEAAVAEVCRGLDGCIVTSNYPECGPMCIMESLATGIPVVSTPGGNALHFLRRADVGGSCGTLGDIVAYGDVDGFARAIKQMIVYGTEWNRRAERRRQKSLVLRETSDARWKMPDGSTTDPDAPYTWQHWADRFGELYLSLASSLRGKVIVSDYISEEDQASFRRSYRSGATESLGPLYVRNFLQVMDYARAGVGISSLTDRLHGAPAVIVGMGPSLDGCVDLLREHQDRIAIIACDAALRKLVSAGIEPTLVLVADPNDRQVENFSGVDGTRFVTALPTIVHPLVFHATRKADCRTAWYNVADNNQEICQHIPRIVGPKGAIQPAVLTTGMAYIAALHLGCSPITFIGSDLCWYDVDKGYASGVSPTKAEWQRRNKIFGNAVMLFPDIVGHAVITEPCFVAFWQWLNDYLAVNGLTAYNSSGCGILHGERIVQRPFDQWIAESIERSSGAGGYRRILVDAHSLARQELDMVLCHQLERDEVDGINRWAASDSGAGPIP